MNQAPEGNLPHDQDELDDGLVVRVTRWKTAYSYLFLVWSFVFGAITAYTTDEYTS
jgi:hypothetical protein